MRTTRIYQPGTYGMGDHVSLNESASNHVGRVLRMQPGATITLFCGDNREFHATITRVKKHQVDVYIEHVESINRESPCRIHLAQGIAKGERMRFIIQKAVELGAASITPLLTQHGAVKHNHEQHLKKHAQWEAIVISACEQSGRNTLPPITPPQTFAEYLSTCQAHEKWVLDPKSSHRLLLSAKPKHDRDIVLLIGPEGGLSPEELREAEQASFCGLSLGPRILRTETATLAALSLLQAQCGDL